MNIKFFILITLIATLVSLIIFLFAQSPIITNYQFSNQMKIDYTNQHDSIIGTVAIDNQQFFPKKLDLKNFKACLFNNDSIFTYNVYYSKSDSNYALGYNNFTNTNVVEVPMLTNTKYTLKISLQYPLMNTNLEKRLYFNSIQKTNRLYIYNTDKFKKMKYPEFCQNVGPQNSSYQIEVTNSI